MCKGNIVVLKGCTPPFIMNDIKNMRPIKLLAKTINVVGRA